jgi:hypothetical protein
MSFIKDVCQGKKSDYIHKQFVRFGKGQYQRFLTQIKVGKKLIVKTSFDLSNELFKIVIDTLDAPAVVKGKIITNYDTEGEIKHAEHSKRGKLYTATIDGEFTPTEMKELYEKYKMYYMLLSVKGKDYKVKSKTAIPKPGGKLKDNFCSATLPADKLKDFVFDVDKNFKKISIVHNLEIQEVVIPEDCKNDFAKARLKAIRKGKLVREITIDEEEPFTKEYDLEA